MGSLIPFQFPHLPAGHLFAQNQGIASTAKLTLHIVIEMASTSHHFHSAHVDLQDKAYFRAQRHSSPKAVEGEAG